MEVNSLKTLAEKILISPELPTEDHNIGDAQRIKNALREKGYNNIEIPLSSLRKLYPACRDEQGTYTVTLVHRENSSVLTNIEVGDTTGSLYGIAVDYGSTTLNMQLVDLSAGSVLYETKAINGQRAFGLDILTRIIHGLGGPEKKQELHSAAVSSMHLGFDAIRQATGIDPTTQCAAMVIAGNTTMIHFLLELDAWTVFSSPYAPVVTNPGFFTGRELEINFDGYVYIMPSASNYIGGDIVSGLITLNMSDSDDVQVLFDVGTNGELVMGCREWMIAGAGAAGPALEGDISKYGMVAGSGAITKILIENDNVTWETIDDAAPLGICGSGIIDLMAQMRLNGWIDVSGELNPKASKHIERRENEDGETEYAAIYTHAKDSGSGEDLYFSQTDIRRYIETKAAAHTMVDCLLDAAGISEDRIDRMYLTGSMCSHSDLESAITIGIFPDLPREKYVGLANSSLDGARTLLLDRSKFKDINKILEGIFCVQFASMPDFMIRMQASKFLPHTDEHRYPRVFAELKKRGLR